MTAKPPNGRPARLFLAGDVMLGRGIDMIMPHPGDPTLYEPAMTSAEGYVRLAERRSGRLPRRVEPNYVWGDLLPDLGGLACDLRLINLETAVTRTGTPAPKGINYRMHPENVGVLTALPADICVLANNHVLDWGPEGLVETLAVLRDAGIPTVGAGLTQAEAAAPCITDLNPGRRLLVLAFGAGDSGIPAHWQAGPDRPGVNLLTPGTEATVREVNRRLDPVRRQGDIVVVSIHWGGNWGYAIPTWHRQMAHALVDHAGVHVVHGHSSHHPRRLEMRNGRIILYGCGDLINDYEGIGGYEEFRSDLVFGYLAEFGAEGTCSSLRLLPYRIGAFRLQHPDREELRWLTDRMNEQCAAWGAHFDLTSEGLLELSRASPGQG